jgi:hypothetical protein
MIKYFYTDGIDKFGPFSKEELKSQKITRKTKIWYLGLNEWTQLEEIESLNDILISIPPELHKSETIEKRGFRKAENQLFENIFKLKNNSTAFRWFLGTIVSILLFFIVRELIIKQSEVDLKKKIESNSYNTEENFDVYLKKYFRDLSYFGIFPKKPKVVTIKFSRLDQFDNTTHIHGISYGINDDNKVEIYINPSSWEKFSKSMRYYLIYHELSHDILNLSDLEAIHENKGKLMYPELSSYENKNMDEFIESSHALFEEQSKK